MKNLTVLVVLFASATASAQQDLSSRLRTVSGVPKHLRYDVCTRTVLPAAGAQAHFGPRKIYNNTCPQPMFLALSPGDQVLDEGQVPSTSNFTRDLEFTACEDQYEVNGFQVAYCSNQPSVDLNVTFHDQYDPCTDITTSTMTAGFALVGLPGASSGGAACYVVDVDLVSTSLEFSLLADGDGVWDGSSSDRFGFTVEATNLTGTSVGPVVAGDPLLLGGGCEWGVDTIFEQKDPTRSGPFGTGWGTSDRFGLQDTVAGMLIGCFDFGGWPDGALASTHLVLYSEDDCCCDEAFPLCPGTVPAPCPCGNNSATGNEGCLNSSGSGGSLMAPATASLSGGGLFIEASYPPGNGSLVLTTDGMLFSVGLFDGHACVGGGPRVLPGADNGVAPDVAANDGIRRIGDVWSAMNALAPGYVIAGGLYRLQVWYRDVLCGPPPAPCPSPCGTGANLTPAVAVRAAI